MATPTWWLPRVRFGRYGWINLAGPLAASRASWTRAGLARLVESMTADELRWIMAGGRRRQLRSRIGEEQVREALAGDRAARRALRVALADSLLDVAPWLMRTDADELHHTCLRILNDLPVLDRRPSTVATTAALDELGAERLLERVAPGISYGPGVLDRVVLVTSARTAPILVAVDEDDQTVILHPPIADGRGTDATSRLREIGRALGDDTRIRVLQQLRARDLHARGALRCPHGSPDHPAPPPGHAPVGRAGGSAHQTRCGAQPLLHQRHRFRITRDRSAGVHNSVTVSKNFDTAVERSPRVGT